MALLCLAHASQATVNWQVIPSLNTARNTAAAGVTDNKLYVFGGNDINANNLNTTEVLNLTQPSMWIPLADNSHVSGASEVTGATIDGQYYVFGAKHNNSTPAIFNFVEQYDPASNSWSTKAAMPTTRSGSVAVNYKNEIVVFGGTALKNGKDNTKITSIV